MRNNAKIVLLLTLLLLFGLACDRGFNEATGVYRAKGVTATFPTGWETFRGAPYSVVARADPNSSAKVLLTVQDVPGVTMEEYLEQRANGLTSGGMKEVDQGPIEVDSVEGRWSIVDQEQQGKPFRAIMYMFMTNGTLYSVMGLTETPDFSTWEPRFDDIAKSIDFE